MNVHNRMKHANYGNDNVIPSNNNVMLKILFYYITKSLYYIHCLYKKNKKKKHITIIEIKIKYYSPLLI